MGHDFLQPYVIVLSSSHLQTVVISEPRSWISDGIPNCHRTCLYYTFSQVTKTDGSIYLNNRIHMNVMYYFITTQKINIHICISLQQKQFRAVKLSCKYFTGNNWQVMYSIYSISCIVIFKKHDECRDMIRNLLNKCFIYIFYISAFIDVFFL